MAWWAKKLQSLVQEFVFQSRKRPNPFVQVWIGTVANKWPAHCKCVDIPKSDINHQLVRVRVHGSWVRPDKKPMAGHKANLMATMSYAHASGIIMDYPSTAKQMEVSWNVGSP